MEDDNTAPPAETDTDTAETPELGDAGTKALREMKTKWHSERDARKALEAELAALKGTAAPVDPAKPTDDITAIVAAAVAEAMANARPRFEGTGDGGAARKASGPTQLTKADLAGMSAQQITAAKKNGQLRDLLAGQ